MKITAIIVLALALMGCSVLTEISARVSDAGEFEILRNGSITVEAGEYQAGFKIRGSGTLDIITTGGIEINSMTAVSLSTPGEYWVIITANSDGLIQSTRIDGDYYLEDGPEYETTTLEIEVEL